jgi:hypothetical protein
MTYLSIFDAGNGGFVDIHPLHGRDELPANSEAACILANHEHQIELLPTIPAAAIEARAEWLWDVFEAKNPDIRIDGFRIRDIKTPEDSSMVRKATINRCIYSCAQQRVSIAVINLKGKEYAIQDIKKGIIGALQPGRNKSIEEVWIITGESNLFKVDRCMFFDESIYEVLTSI